MLRQSHRWDQMHYVFRLSVRRCVSTHVRACVNPRTVSTCVRATRAKGILPVRCRLLVLSVYPETVKLCKVYNLIVLSPFSAVFSNNIPSRQLKHTTVYTVVVFDPICAKLQELPGRISNSIPHDCNRTKITDATNAKSSQVARANSDRRSRT